MSHQDTPDLIKSLTDPSVLTEHEGGDDDDNEMPALIGWAHQTQRTFMKAPNSESHPLPRKPGLKIWGPRNWDHTKCPILCGMNGVSMKGLRRDWTPNRCITSHFLWLRNWSSSSLKIVPLISPQYHIRPLYELQTNLLQAPRALMARPSTGSNRARTTSTTLEEGYSPSEGSKAVPLCFQCFRGQTQWKFQKSWILHEVLDVIAVNMESMRRCLDFCDSMPMDQEFWCQNPNLCHLKAVVVKEVAHLTMVLVLDEDHTHYSDTFRNIFKSGALCKKQFPEGLGSIKTRKGGATWVIICHFCLHACSNDNYAYRHLAAIHLNIHWGCGHVMDMLVGI